MAVGIIMVYKVLRVYMKEIQTTMKSNRMWRVSNLPMKLYLANPSFVLCSLDLSRIFASHNFGKGPI